MAGGTSGYDAFISYSHALDGALAPALQTGVERFAKPWYRSRALRVFRDTTNLAANPDLWSSIEQALASSTWLVLMASPKAAQSQWVNREVAWWLANKQPARLLVVLTEGEFIWDGDTALGDGARAALPPALRGAFAEEPRWVDLRWLRDVDQVAQSNPRFRECVVDIAAAVRGVSKDELVGEHIRQHRRTKWLAGSGVTALAVLLIVAVVLMVLARNNAATAREERDVATSRQLAAQATVRLDSDPQLATLLGLAATQIADRYEAQSVLLQLVEHDKQVLRFFGGHTNVVDAVAFSPDGKLLATGSPDGGIVLWDVARHVRLGELAGQVVSDVAFTLDGATLAVADADGVALWDVASRTRRAVLPSPAVGSLGVSADGTRIAGGLTDGTVAVWDTTTGRRVATLLGHTQRVTSVALSPDGHLVAAGGAEGTVLVWDSRTGAQTATIHDYPSEVKGRVAFSPDGTLLALSGLSGAVQLWKVADGSLRTLKGHTRTVQSLAFLDSTTLASGGFDGTAVLWDLSRSFAEQIGTPTVVLAATGDPTGRLIATGGFSGAVVVRDPERGADPVLTLQAPDLVNSLSFSPDRTRLAAGMPGGKVLVWDLGQRRPDRTLDARSNRGVVSVAYSPDGALLAAGLLDGRVVLWGARDGRQVADLPALGLPDVTGLRGLNNMKLAFSPDSRTLAFSTIEGAVLWDVTGRTVRARLARPSSLGTTSLAFSPNGRLVAQGGLDAKIVLWDPDRPAQPVAVLTGQPSSVTGLAFSPDGRTLAAVSNLGTVILWDVDLQAQRAVLIDRGRLVDVVFVDQGRRLFVAGLDTGLRSYDLAPGSWRRRLCGLVGRPLSAQEWHAYIGDRDYQPVCGPTP